MNDAFDSPLTGVEDSFDAFAEEVRDLSLHFWRDAEPGNDAEPFCAFHTQGGDVAILPTGPFFDSEETKTLLGRELMPAAVRALGALRYGFASAIWGIDTTRLIEKGVPPEKVYADFDAWRRKKPGRSFSEHPDHFEATVVIVGEWTGRFNQWTARVTRDDAGVPTIGEWEETGEVDWRNQSDGLRVEGRFITATMTALTDKRQMALDVMREAIGEFPEFGDIMLDELETACDEHGIEFDRDDPFAMEMTKALSKAGVDMAERITGRLERDNPGLFRQLLEFSQRKMKGAA